MVDLPNLEGHFLKTQSFYSTRDHSWNNESLKSPFTSRLLDQPLLDQHFLHTIATEKLTEQENELKNVQKIQERRSQTAEALRKRSQQRIKMEEYCSTPYSKSPVKKQYTQVTIKSPVQSNRHSPRGSRSWQRHHHCRVPSEVSHIVSPVKDVPRLPIGSSLLSSGRLVSTTRSKARPSPQYLEQFKSTMDRLSSNSTDENEIERCRQFIQQCPQKLVYVDSPKLRKKLEQTERLMETCRKLQKGREKHKEVEYCQGQLDWFEKVHLNRS
ncbi:hypothetical protein P9112_002625 [Eukaryota sp. TZLM1-RC]